MKIKKSHLKTAFAACVMAVAAPVCAQSQEFITNAEGETVEVISLKQTEARKIYAEVSARAPIKLRLSGSRFYVDPHSRKEYIRAFAMDLYPRIQAIGVTQTRAIMAASLYTRIYDVDRRIFGKKRFSPLDGMATLPPEVIKMIFSPIMVAEETNLCVRGYGDGNYTTRKWLAALFKMNPEEINISEIEKTFADEFQDYGNMHEKAHCAGAEEPAADYIASLYMLNKTYNTPQFDETVQFLELFAAMRDYRRQFIKINASYNATARAIMVAIHDFKENPEAYSNPEALYKYADKKFDADAFKPEAREKAMKTLKRILPPKAFAPRRAPQA